jgi:hypothetical protein
MPGPPGSGVTSPARRNRTRPIHRLSPVDVPEVSEIRFSLVAETGTNVNDNRTVRRHGFTGTAFGAIYVGLSTKIPAGNDFKKTG